VSWLDAFFAASYQTVAVNGAPLPQEAILNFVGATAADSPSTDSTTITVPTSSTTPDVLVSVSGPSTVAATLYATHEVTTTGGAVVLTLPSGAPTGARVAVKLLTSAAAHSLTVSAPGGGSIEETLEQAGSGGVYGASAVFASAADVGSPYVWYHAGSNVWRSRP
jgi:hypothetical protein